MKESVNKIHTVFALLFVAFVLIPSCTYNSLSFEPDCDGVIVLETISVTPSACEQQSGNIDVRVTDQTLIDVVYSLDGENFQTEGRFENLAAGTYLVTAKNAECQGTLEVQIENAEGLNATAVSNPSSCGVDNGSIEVVAENATGTLSYSLNGGQAQSDAVFNNLAAGSYALSIRDGIGCEVNLSVDIAVDIEFEAVETIINTSCASSGCHGGNVSPDLRVKDNILNNATRIRNFTSSRAMPPSSSGRSLTQAQIETIQCWVDAGAEG